MAGLRSCCLFLSKKSVRKSLLFPNICVNPVRSYNSFAKPSYLYFFPNRVVGLLSGGCVSLVPISYSSLLRHYGKSERPRHTHDKKYILVYRGRTSIIPNH